MAHALTRNRTYEALDRRGEYGNLRTFSHLDHDARFDGDEVYVTSPVAPYFVYFSMDWVARP